MQHGDADSDPIRHAARKGRSVTSDVDPAREELAEFDTSVAHVARVYDYWPGGCFR